MILNLEVCFQVDLLPLYMSGVVRGDTIDCFKGCIMHCNGFAIEDFYDLILWSSWWFFFNTSILIHVILLINLKNVTFKFRFN